MSLVWIDGFEAYGAAGDKVDLQMRRAGYYMARPFSGNTSPTISSFTRRGIGLSLLPNTWNYNGGPQVQIGATAKVIAGLAICIPTPLLPGYDFTPGQANWGGTSVLSFNRTSAHANAANETTYDDEGIGPFQQNCNIAINEDLSIAALYPGGLSGQWSAPGVITPGLWQYLEVCLDSANSLVTIRLDGIVVVKAAWTVNYPPVNTVVLNVAGCAGVGFLAVDDFYICNGDGESFTDFLGDVVVHAIYPNGEGYVVNTEAIVGGPSAHAALLANPPGGTSKFITTGANDADTVLFTPQSFPPDFIDVLAVEICAQFPKGNIAALPAPAPSTPSGGTAIIMPLGAMGNGSGGGGGVVSPGMVVVSGAPPTFKTGDPPASGVTPFDLAIVQNVYSALIGNAVKVNPTPIPNADVENDDYVIAKLLLPAMPEGGPWTTDNAQDIQFGVVFSTPTSGQIDFSAIYYNALATYSPDYGFIDVILDDVFPNDISYESVGSTRFATDVIVVDSGSDQRVQRWDQPLMEYDVGYGVRTMEQLQAMIAFFRAMRGRKMAFNYLDHVDNTSSVAVNYEARRAPPVTPFDQTLANAADGVQTVFQLTKTYTSQTQTQVRPIYRPVPGTVRMGVAGKEVTNFTVDGQGRVTFSTPLSIGVGHTVTKDEPGNANNCTYTGQPGDFSALRPYVNNGWFVGVSGFPLPNDNIAPTAGAIITSLAADGSWCSITFPHGIAYQTAGATTESLTLTINLAPPQGFTVTAGFKFYVPVRFDTDTLPITLHEYGVGGANSVKLIEVRPSSWG